MRQDATTAEPSVFRSGLEPLLRVLVQKNGSDLYLSANNPPMVRINGYCVPVSSRPLAPQTPQEMLQACRAKRANSASCPAKPSNLR